jgi:hypothetical protein
LDRVLVHGDDIWPPEIKHKYPMQEPVSFGLNSGELNVIMRLGEAGSVTVAILMKQLDRNEGGITSRLVRVGAAASRDEIQAESQRREQALGKDGK